MRLRLRRLSCVLTLAAVTLLILPPLLAEAQQRPAPPANPVTSLFNMRLGGFVQTNTTWDSDENQDDSPSSFREYATRRDRRTENQETLRWSAARTRLFVDVRGPELLGARTRAFTEFDWDGLKLNDDGDSSATAAHTPRLRHAYARFDWPAVYLTIGQTTLIFNSVVGSASSMENVSSGHGDITGGSRNRVPQFILGGVIPIGGAKLELAGSVGRHGTDQNPADVGDNAQGLNDSGARSGVPALQGLVKGTVPIFGRDLVAAVSTYWGQATLTETSAGNNRGFRDIHSTGLAVELLVPLPPIPGIGGWDFRGAWFNAENMSAWNLGHNGLTNATVGGNPREISAWGGWGELNLDLPMGFGAGAGWGYVKEDRDWVIRRNLAQQIYENTGRWMFVNWETGPVLTELFYGRVDTNRVDGNSPTRGNHKTNSDTVMLMFRYRF